INVDGLMTTEQIQAEFDAIGNLKGGVSITIQFSDITCTAALTLAGITGNGAVNIKGPAVMDFSGYGLRVLNCTIPVVISDIAINTDTTTANYAAIYIYSSNFVTVDGVTIAGTSTAKGKGVEARYSRVEINNSEIGDVKHAIYVRHSQAMCTDNSAITDRLPGYGVYALELGTAGLDGTTITGQIADTLPGQTGEIR
ncbi:MAG: hypothetical protein GY757_08745, partial [bacterium]|nr:hypothetical protein [bacterium]